MPTPQKAFCARCQCMEPDTVWIGLNGNITCSFTFPRPCDLEQNRSRSASLLNEKLSLEMRQLSPLNSSQSHENHFAHEAVNVFYNNTKSALDRTRNICQTHTHTHTYTHTHTHTHTNTHTQTQPAALLFRRPHDFKKPAQGQWNWFKSVKFHGET